MTVACVKACEGTSRSQSPCGRRGRGGPRHRAQSRTRPRNTGDESALHRVSEGTLDEPTAAGGVALERRNTPLRPEPDSRPDLRPPPGNAQGRDLGERFVDVRRVAVGRLHASSPVVRRETAMARAKSFRRRGNAQFNASRWRPLLWVADVAVMSAVLQNYERWAGNLPRLAILVERISVIRRPSWHARRCG